MSRRTEKNNQVPVVYILDARSPERGFIAGTPLEQGEPVVGQLMMGYEGHIGVITY